MTTRPYGDALPIIPSAYGRPIVEVEAELAELEKQPCQVCVELQRAGIDVPCSVCPASKTAPDAALIGGGS